MPYKQVIRLFEHRKEKLQDILEGDIENNTKIRLEGAIDEIDFLLTSLRQEFGLEQGHSVVGDGSNTAIVAHQLVEEKKALGELVDKD
jgi:hypothetical protein